jgi:hypothetical protein
MIPPSVFLQVFPGAGQKPGRMKNSRMERKAICPTGRYRRETGSKDEREKDYGTLVSSQVDL